MKRRDGGEFPCVTVDAQGVLKRALSLDLREIRHRAGRLADFVEQLEPVLAHGLVVDIDGDLVEEGIDGGRSLAIALMAAAKSSLPTAAEASFLATSIASASAFSSACW